MKEMKQKYDFREVEEGKYDTWVNAGYYNAVGEQSGKEPFCMVIPPPNVTGILHLGHAWNTTIQDMIARYKRMNQYDVLWMSGMDHAGIATQAKVEERLRAQGLNKYEMGKEKFLEISWDWKEEYASIIRQQWAKLGLSLDYSRERFTLDEGLSEAVKKVFVSLYEKGLIYRGERIINWDVEAKTALSNIEVIHKEIEGAFYTFRYPVVGSEETLLVATTRPETMFGDVCVVVNPEDERFKSLIGKKVINPANREEIPIIADKYVELEFGTGAMKCTPAHDPNDFALAEKHDLEKILCMHPDGTMNERAGIYENMERFACRAALVKQIEEEGNLEKIEKVSHAVGHSERTDSIVEPYMSKQWFVKMGPLVEEVIQQQKSNDKIDFYPKRFEKTFMQWLENIEDWCISRQLWWGHSIPAWYHKETGEVYVGLETPNDIENYTPDEDVLDTWFSSALWPFSTLGWPEETEDFKRYYPNNVLVTAYDIIFFWVARMAFQGKYFTGKKPFDDVLIHGLIRDADGRKMSKSLGNGVDPMEVINTYGVDALRFFLTTNSTPGQDTRYIEEKVDSSWNFINKIWNAARFVQMNLEKETLQTFDINQCTMIDEWILSRLNETITSVNQNMDKYEFAQVGNELYGFIWDDFCNWYIELSKANLNSEDMATRKASLSTLYTVLMAIIKLLHPFMPFVTEEIYLALPHEKESINLESWPVSINLSKQNQSLDAVAQLISIIKTTREIRVEYQLKPKDSLEVQLFDDNNQAYFPNGQEMAILEKMANIAVVNFDIDGEKIVRPLKQGALHIAMSDLVNIEDEIVNLEKEKLHLETEIKRASAMLGNKNFVDKAAKEKVDAERQKLEDYKKQYEIVVNRLLSLKEM